MCLCFQKLRKRYGPLGNGRRKGHGKLQARQLWPIGKFLLMHYNQSSLNRFLRTHLVIGQCCFFLFVTICRYGSKTARMRRLIRALSVRTKGPFSLDGHFLATQDLCTCIWILRSFQDYCTYIKQSVRQR